MPTEPGYYWYKFLTKPWAIVYISKHRGRLLAMGQDGPCYWLDDTANGWIECVVGWDGPIQPPSEAS